MGSRLLPHKRGRPSQATQRGKPFSFCETLGVPVTRRVVHLAEIGYAMHAEAPVFMARIVKVSVALSEDTPTLQSGFFRFGSILPTLCPIPCSVLLSTDLYRNQDGNTSVYRYTRGPLSSVTLTWAFFFPPDRSQRDSRRCHVPLMPVLSFAHALDLGKPAPVECDLRCSALNVAQWCRGATRVVEMPDLVGIFGLSRAGARWAHTVHISTGSNLGALAIKVHRICPAIV